MKIINDDGAEVEVFTADELNAKVTEAVTAKESEFGKTKAQIEAERDEARKTLGERAGQFAQFRKLSDDAVAKLSIAERTIYENGVALNDEREKNKKLEEERATSMVDSVLKSKSNGDEKLFGKMKDMWSIIGIDAQTPEQIEGKAKMILGAISTTEPDLLASVGFGGGSWNPPTTKKEEDKSFADTPQGQAGANELGLKLK